MASAGKKAATGAASGAAAGAALGPWGALAGGVIGGIGGYLQGDDPSAPGYVAPPPPITTGGSTSQYGGVQYDPVTGRVIYTDNTSNGYGQASQYQNELMRQMLLGGNGAQIGLDDQIATQRALIARLQGLLQQKAVPGAKNVPAEYRDLQRFLDKEGNLPNISDTNAIIQGRINTPQAQELVKQFWSDTGGNYGSKNKDIAFGKWVRDFMQRNLVPLHQAFQKTQDVQSGNEDTTAQGLQAAQQRLENLLRVQSSGAAAQEQFAQNPLMNFLNKRNQTAGPARTEQSYMGDYADPNIETMQDTFAKYLGKADEDTDSTAFKIAGAVDPGMPDARMANARLLGAAGASGGERMAGPAPYDGSKIGAFLAGLNRTAERSMGAQMNLAEQNAARRGVMGGSSDIARLAMAQELEDQKAANAARGYEMDTNDRDKWFNQNFMVNQHNSEVARNTGQARLQALSGAYGNELAAKDFYSKLQNQAWLNNQNLKQQNFGNAMTSLNQRTGLSQRQIDNARYAQGYDDTQNRQNFADRMGLLGYLQGADQQQYTQGIGNSQMALGQGTLGFQVGQGAAGQTNNWNAANTAGQNAQNMAQWQQSLNDSAATQQAFGQFAGGMGSAIGSNPSAWGFGGNSPRSQTPAQMPSGGSYTPPSGYGSTGGMPDPSTGGSYLSPMRRTNSSLFRASR